MKIINLHVKLLFVTFGIIILSNCKVTEASKMGELERYYSQGHYRIVEKKANSNLEKEKYKNNATLYLYKAVSLANLAQDKRYLNSHPDAMKQSFLAYQMYFNLIAKDSNADKMLLSELRKIYTQQKFVDVSPEAYAFLIVKKEKILIEKEKSKPLVAVSNLKDSILDDSYSKEEQMIAYAKQYIGVPYRYGGTNSKGFDCSGYTQHVLGKYGHVIPRSARYQKQKLNKIPIKKAKKGDLIFFSKNRRVISHVGIVISEEGEDLTMIHASSSRGIMITNVATNSYWKPKLVSAGRVD